MKNYYELLEVNEKASDEIIKKVYKIHIKKNHPDLFEGNEKTKAEEKLKKINEAYETLIDSAKRKEYDECLKNDDMKLLEENEHLKQVLKDKQNVIDSLMGNGFKGSIDERFIEPEIQETEQVDYKEEYSYDNKFDWQKIVSVAVTVILVSVFLLIFTDINLFEVFWDTLKRMF